MSDVTITIAATTMEGTPAVDPDMKVTRSEVQPFQRQLNVPQSIALDGEIRLQIDADLGANPLWVVSPTFSRFEPSDGVQYRPSAEPHKTIHLTLVRSLSAWNARFMRYVELPSPRFDAFKAAVAVSKNVDLKFLNQFVGDLETQYDLLDLLPQLMAKTALLNLYAVLTDEIDPISNVPWWSYVQEVVRIDQERFVAVVKKDLFDHVKEIVGGIGVRFPTPHYSTETEADFPLHYPNIPARYHCPDNLAEPMVTLKIQYQQGDVQLTMTSYKTGEYLLDCDMDEHLNFFGHTVDLAAHAAEELVHSPTAGTHPFLMHEYIVRDSAQQPGNGGVATVALGYELV
jgi:hypothetical protein